LTSGPPPTVNAFAKSIVPIGHTFILVMYVSLYVFKFTYCILARGVGLGLSPDPWLYYFLYDHVIIYMCAGIGTPEWNPRSCALLHVTIRKCARGFEIAV
jgi:hypothetical protein